VFAARGFIKVHMKKAKLFFGNCSSHTNECCTKFFFKCIYIISNQNLQSYELICWRKSCDAHCRKWMNMVGSSWPSERLGWERGGLSREISTYSLTTLAEVSVVEHVRNMNTRRLYMYAVKNQKCIYTKFIKHPASTKHYRPRLLHACASASTCRSICPTKGMNQSEVYCAERTAYMRGFVVSMEDIINHENIIKKI
jgi:hypothetical protein